ncbi:MAG: AAA family ATPase [Bacteroidia bacterium]|nr:MAG: AAA family ATPase [Bacteroidia bacterium]
MEYSRPQLRELKERILAPRRQLQMLVGPRQVGKTTMVGQLLRGLSMPVVSVSADGVLTDGRAWISQVWSNVRRLLAEGAGEALLVIDEVQKVDQWSSVVKAEWDADTRDGLGLKVLLLGSSTLLIDRGLSESLMGRFRLMRLGHWSYREMADAFGWSLEQYVYFGGYPGSAGFIDREDDWYDYVLHSLVEPTISLDVLMMSQVNKPMLLRRAFELGCAYSGQLLSYTKMLGQLQDKGNTTTLSHYLKLLDEAGLLGALEKYAGEELRRRASIPKFQVYNSALLAAQGHGSFQSARLDGREWGRRVESAVGAHLLNQCMGGALRLYYWRDGGQEVDFVLEHRGRVVALEVKSNAAGMKRGMEAFVRRFSPHRTYLVGEAGLPLGDFLSMDARGLF